MAENKKKSSKGAKIAKIAGIVLLVLVVVLLLLLWQLDRIAAVSTRTVGSAITGTKVDVESISISPFAGDVKVKGFSVGNVEGFHKPEMIKVDSFHVDAGMKSLLSDKIEVEALELSGVEIDFEYSFTQGSNIDALIKNVEKNTGADKKKAAAKEEKAAEKEEPAKDAAAKQVVIRKLVLKDINVIISSPALKTAMKVPLVPIEMENVGEKSNLGEAISEVLTRILTEVLKVVDLNALGKGLSDAGDAVLKGVDGAVGVVGGAVVSAGDSAGKAVQGTLEQTKKLIKGLPGLGN